MKKPAKRCSQLDRREALQTGGAIVALAASSGASGVTSRANAATPSLNASDRTGPGFWPNDARLAVSLSLMFEGGGQAISGAGGVIEDIADGYLSAGDDDAGVLGAADANVCGIHIGPGGNVTKKKKENPNSENVMAALHLHS